MILIGVQKETKVSWNSLHPVRRQCHIPKTGPHKHIWRARAVLSGWLSQIRNVKISNGARKLIFRKLISEVGEQWVWRYKCAFRVLFLALIAMEGRSKLIGEKVSNIKFKCYKYTTARFPKVKPWKTGWFFIIPMAIAAWAKILKGAFNLLCKLFFRPMPKGMILQQNWLKRKMKNFFSQHTIKTKLENRRILMRILSSHAAEKWLIERGRWKAGREVFQWSPWNNHYPTVTEDRA